MIEEIVQEYAQLYNNKAVSGTGEEIAYELANFHVDELDDSHVMLLCVNYEIYTQLPLIQNLRNVSLVSYARECLKRHIVNTLLDL